MSNVSGILPSAAAPQAVTVIRAEWNQHREEMIETLGPKGFAALLEIFISRNDQCLADMDARREDLPALRETAHTLKGGASFLGFEDLTALARSLEEACKQGIAELAVPLIDEVKQMLVLADAQARALLNEVIAMDTRAAA